jgi:hypothetical protein
MSSRLIGLKKLTPEIKVPIFGMGVDKRSYRESGAPPKDTTINVMKLLRVSGGADLHRVDPESRPRHTSKRY